MGDLDNLTRRIKNENSSCKLNDCKLEISGFCPECGKIMGNCWAYREDSKKWENIGIYRFQNTAVEISSEEIQELPQLVCKYCSKKEAVA